MMRKSLLTCPLKIVKNKQVAGIMIPWFLMKAPAILRKCNMTGNKFSAIFPRTENYNSCTHI